MSYIILNGAPQPAKNGLTKSDNPATPNTFFALAYCHPDSPTTFFSASPGSMYYDVEKGWMHTGMRSSVKDKVIPDKSDIYVWGISADEYLRLADCEKRWWKAASDYAKKPQKSFKDGVNHAHQLVVDEKWQ